MADRKDTEQKELFAAKIVYDFTSINRLSLTISKCCRLHFRLLLYALGLVLVLFSLYTQMGSSLSIFVLAIGCFMITFINVPSKMRAKQSWQSIGSKPLAGFYSFYEHVFTFLASGQKSQVEYDDIKQLIEDDEYLYLFTDKSSAYMVDKSRTSPSMDNLKNYLAKETGLSWRQPFSILNFRLRLFRKK